MNAPNQQPDAIAQLLDLIHNLKRETEKALRDDGHRYVGYLVAVAGMSITAAALVFAALQISDQSIPSQAVVGIGGVSLLALFAKVEGFVLKDIKRANENLTAVFLTCKAAMAYLKQFDVRIQVPTGESPAWLFGASEIKRFLCCKNWLLLVLVMATAAIEILDSSG